MANYFLKNVAGSRIYRIEYVPLGGDNYTVNSVYCTADMVGLPDKTVVGGIDVSIAQGNVIVDLVFDSVVPATQAEYRALAKSVIDTRW